MVWLQPLTGALWQRSGNNDPWFKPAHEQFLYGSWAKNAFYTLKRCVCVCWGAERITYCAKWKWYEVNISVTLNKVSLEHSHACSFIHLSIACGCFRAMKIRVGSCHRDCTALHRKKKCRPLFLAMYLIKMRGALEGRGCFQRKLGAP